MSLVSALVSALAKIIFYSIKISRKLITVFLKRLKQTREIVLMQIIKSSNSLPCLVMFHLIENNGTNHKRVLLTLPATGFFGPYKLRCTLPHPGQNSVGLWFCNRNWYTDSLLCYKYTEEKKILKKKIFGLWRHLLGIWRKIVKKVKKRHFFFKFISFHVHKRFWSSFICKYGSMIDDKNVHEGLKIEKLSQKSVFCRLKNFKIEYLKVEKINDYWLWNFAHY